MTTNITICLCTFKRSSLSDTLVSLEKQALPSGVVVDVVVVDSDLAGSAAALVAQAQEKMTVAVRYLMADRPGVAAARNKAVGAATGQWLAFIDDDEYAEPNWLAGLLGCAEQYGVQVVFGAVRTLYPEGCPRWIEEGDLFGKPLAPTGTPVNNGPTCNALVASAALASESIIFDMAYGTTGGEDTELFFRLSQKGILMVTCREAVVSETVESHRLNRVFLMRKALRVGETYYRIFFAGAGAAARAKLLAKAAVQWIAASVIAGAMRPFGLGRSMRYQIKAAANLGKLRAATGFAAVELYKG
jgi:succinoglycan biosynthesis protein ExoM